MPLYEYKVYAQIHGASNLAHQPAGATFGDIIYSADQYRRVFSISDIHSITTFPEAQLRSLYQIPYLSGDITVEHRK